MLVGISVSKIIQTQIGLVPNILFNLLYVNSWNYEMPSMSLTVESIEWCA